MKKMGWAAKTPPSLVSLVLLSGSAAMVMNLFMASLPEMARDFNVEYSQIQLAITAYLMGTAFSQVILGPLSDYYGRRSVILLAFAVFAIASAGASLAQSFESFMIFRMLQCVVVAGLVVPRASIRDQLAGDQAASRIAYVAMGMALVPMVAPAIGGMLDEFFGWRSSFYFFTLIGVFVVIVTYLDFGETKITRSASMLAQFKTYPDLFRSRRFWGYTFILAFATGMFFVYLSGGPLLGDRVNNLSGGWLGLYLGAPPLGYFFGNFVSAKMATRWGVGRLIWYGLLASVIGMGFALIPVMLGLQAPIWFFGFTIFIGFGNGMTVPSANAGLLDARPDLAGTASGLSGAIVMFLGASLAQLGGTILEAYTHPSALIIVILISGLLGLAVAYWVLRLEACLKNSPE